MSKNLLIVESPAKIKSITKVLGSDYHVLASFGHVRDLAKKDGAVDPEHGFAMRYEVIERNARHVQEIARAMKQAEVLWLATDLDREGEAISWHLHEILSGKGLLKGKEVRRVVFPEITPRAIRDAIARPRALSVDLVNAQQARRALDHLVGFKLSPLLWRKVQRGLSAGRVQSPALRLIVEREKEIEAFVAREYWTVHADCQAREVAFEAKLVELAGRKLETFDLADAAAAEAARQRCEQAAAGRLVVRDVRRKDRQRRPAPPFITSTLQQEAARKLGFSTQRTMRVAQQLYEGVAIDEGVVGLITYMRTDSVNLSREALDEIRQAIARFHGTELLPEAPNFFQTRSKSAQEAHEAIRPTSALRQPAALKRYLSDDLFRLYELIWKRTLACQMRPALLNTVTVDLAAGEAGLFRTSGTTVVFPGFLTVYEEGRDARAAEDEEARKLPALEIGEAVPVSGFRGLQHFTEPPPRYSEASLVKALEELGIGRPSTYANIIQTLLKREYVLLDARRFLPTDIGRAVSDFLSAHFAPYVDYGFTARLEDDLDAVANGERQWQPLLADFWAPFKALVDEKLENVSRREARPARLLGTDPESGLPVTAQLGSYGPYVQIGEVVEGGPKPRRASLRPGQTIATLSLDEALKLFALPRRLGTDPQGREVRASIGRFGPYVQVDGEFASLPRGGDPHTITLDEALALLQAKAESMAARTIHAFADGRIRVIRGRFGAYVTDGERRARIGKGVDPEGLDQAACEALLAAAPVTGKRRGAARTAKSATVAKRAPGRAKPAAGDGAAASEGAGRPAARAAKRKSASARATGKRAVGKAKPKTKSTAEAKPKAKAAATGKTGAAGVSRAKLTKTAAPAPGMRRRPAA